jgi:hypothetical protein
MLPPRDILLLPTQKKVWDAPEQTVCCIAGVGTGKSLLLGWMVAREAYKYPNNIIIVAAATAPQLKMSTIPTCLEAWDMMGIAYVYKEYKATVEFPNGSWLKFQSLDIPAAELKGSTIGALFVDEIDACGQQHIESLRQRVRRPLSSRVERFFGNSPPPGHWLEEKFAPREIGARTWGRLFTASTYENRFLAADYIARLEGQYPPGTPAHDRYMMGKMGIAIEGAVYAEYAPERHWVKRSDVPKDLWQFAYGLDLGHDHPTVFLKAALAQDDTLYILKEHARSRALLREHAAAITEMYAGGPIFSDHDAQDRFELLDLGVNTVPADKDVLRGIQAVRRRLRDDKLKIVAEDCPRLCWEFPRYVWDKNEKPKKIDDDALDALRYVSVGFDATDPRDEQLFQAMRGWPN